jgi:hypothetical protein
LPREQPFVFQLVLSSLPTFTAHQAPEDILNPQRKKIMKSSRIIGLLGLLLLGNILLAQEALSDSLRDQLQPYLDSLRGDSLGEITSLKTSTWRHAAWAA